MTNKNGVTKENKYYFYNGFAKPLLVEVEELTLTDNYRGNMTDDLLESHAEYVNQSDDDYNEEMSYYGILRNPKLVDFMLMNSAWFDHNNLTTYLEDWSERMSVLDKFELVELIDKEFNEIEDIDWEEDLVDIDYYAEQLGYSFSEELNFWIKEKVEVEQ